VHAGRASATKLVGIEVGERPTIADGVRIERVS